MLYRYQTNRSRPYLVNLSNLILCSVSSWCFTTTLACSSISWLSGSYSLKYSCFCVTLTNSNICISLYLGIAACAIYTLFGISFLFLVMMRTHVSDHFVVASIGEKGTIWKIGWTSSAHRTCQKGLQTVDRW